ncbi:ATPase synthesis protein 25, mitochondrial [Fusarium duplospermum]|uniref:ATPase synthesis protein 25 n=1 Tax=Fusarium duplospermum TaxID=1325734 RepID=A0A428R1W9_9HYPO|nr:ATPase synthesis protein 25, mitochondrial [Fusarium duplospermum]
MITRPVAAALSCRQCQSAILRAVVSRPTASSLRTLPQRQARQLPILTKRFFSEEKTIEPKAERVAEVLTTPENVPETNDKAESDDVPWFLEVEPPRHPESQHKVELPKVPENAPEVVGPMIKYIFEDMGLDDISLLDLRDLDPPAALGPNLIMLFGTARSERHLHISSGRFVRWLKKNYDIAARADGLIGPGELRTKLRRLRKKAKLMGTNTAIIPGGDNGISTGWVCVHFSSSGDNTNETASFDDTGRFSGFGAPQTGTTVVVQCMTEARRGELDLETLWQGVFKKNLQENKKARGEKFADAEELNKVLASKIQLPTSASALQWQAMQKASQQRRSYSTSARRLSSVAQEKPTSDPRVEMAEVAEEPVIIELAQIRQHIQDIQLIGTPIDQDLLHSLIRGAMMTPSPNNAAKDRLSLVDQLLLMAEERGMEIWNDDMFVTLIEAGLLSPCYGPEIQRAQKNLEYLMKQKGCRFDGDQVLRLMNAYACRQDWDRFWDAFRMPPRFKMARESKHYELAYRTMALTSSQKMCIAALRWVYPEMMSQDPPIMLVGALYESLKACLMVADPGAVTWLYNQNINRYNHLRPVQRRRLENREFLKVLREVESIRAELMRAGLVKEGSAAMHS